MRYIVLIWVRPGMRDALHACEQDVLPIMARHGGHFDVVIDVTDINDQRCKSRQAG